jgi:hypothetical protein
MRGEMATASVVWSRVYPDDAIVEVAPDGPGLGLPPGQPPAQRGDEVALKEVAMGRGYVNRPALDG